MDISNTAKAYMQANQPARHHFCRLTDLLGPSCTPCGYHNDENCAFELGADLVFQESWDLLAHHSVSHGQGDTASWGAAKGMKKHPLNS